MQTPFSLPAVQLPMTVLIISEADRAAGAVQGWSGAASDADFVLAVHPADGSIRVVKSKRILGADGGIHAKPTGVRIVDTWRQAPAAEVARQLKSAIDGDLAMLSEMSTPALREAMSRARQTALDTEAYPGPLTESEKLGMMRVSARYARQVRLAEAILSDRGEL